MDSKRLYWACTILCPELQSHDQNRFDINSQTKMLKLRNRHLSEDSLTMLERLRSSFSNLLYPASMSFAAHLF